MKMQIRKINNKLSFVIVSFIYFIITIPSISQTTIPNADFETWIGGEPQNWDTSNKNILGTIFQGVSQDTINPQNGNSSALLETTLELVGYVPVTLPGLVTLGEIIIDYVNQTANITAGIPFSGRPDEFKGYFKSSPSVNDSCFIGIAMLKWNGSQNDTIAQGMFIVSSKIQNWTEFIIPLDYNTTDNPDSMNIIISSSDIVGMAPVLGSAIWIDNLTLVYGGVSVVDIITSRNFAVYPDETGDNLCISLNFFTPRKTSISLFSTDGKELFQTEKQIEKTLEKISIASLPPGIYIVDVRTAKGDHYSQKILIK